MKDQYDRTIDYLRISITDACNLRCRYCMPESAAGCALEQAEQNPPLTVEEMLKIVHAAAGLGITHYRITGGEPLVRKECVELVQKIKAVPGTASVGITTNGVRLASCARDLKAAGCDSVNVSLDTVDAAEFAAITGRDALEQVKQGICRFFRLRLQGVTHYTLPARWCAKRSLWTPFTGLTPCVILRFTLRITG